MIKHVVGTYIRHEFISRRNNLINYCMSLSLSFRADWFIYNLHINHTGLSVSGGRGAKSLFLD